MNGCPFRTEQPQEPDPRTSHTEEDQDQSVTWQQEGSLSQKQNICLPARLPTHPREFGVES